MRAKSVLPFAFAALGITTLFVLTGSRRRPGTGGLVEPIVEAPPVATSSGIAVRDGLIVIESWDRWIAFAEPALREAKADGARGPDGLLTHVLRRALPDHPWPPEDEQLSGQWRDMVRALANTLEPDPMRGHAKLRVV